MSYMNPRIEINPQICHGKPIIKGTRVMVSTVLGALAAGDSIETVIEDCNLCEFYPAIFCLSS